MDHNFFYGIKDAIRTMREAGMNDVLIGWVIYEIRAQAIHSESRRLEDLRAANPPSFSVTGFEIAEMIKDKEE